MEIYNWENPDNILCYSVFRIKIIDRGKPKFLKMQPLYTIRIKGKGQSFGKRKTENGFFNESKSEGMKE